MLSASFCSAIIFSKIARTQSIAHVVFSDTLVIRFGDALLRAEKNTHNNSDEEDNWDGRSFASSRRSVASSRSLGSRGSRRSGRKSITRFPCPIVEFRVVNLLHSETRGEIMNCKLNIVASTLEEVTKLDTQEEAKGGILESVLPSTESLNAGMKMLQSLKDTKLVSRASFKIYDVDKSQGTVFQKMSKTLSDYTSQRNIYNADTAGGANNHAEGEPFKDSDKEKLEQEQMSYEIHDDSKSSHASRRTLARSQSLFIDEEPSEEGKQARSRRVFSKVEIETDSHPFFKVRF